MGGWGVAGGGGGVGIQLGYSASPACCSGVDVTH